MATDNQTNIEYLIVKCFLYKYTPPFTPVEGKTIVNPNTPRLSTFDAYSTVLDDTKYFTKYDISPYVVSYSFDQNMDNITYSWNLELQDLSLSFSTIDSKLKVPSPPGGNTTGLAFSTSTDSIERLASYETNSDTAKNPSALTSVTNTITSSKENRGKSTPQLTVQNPNLTGALLQPPGLRLSDLIQEYDFISVYIYKNTIPITDISGTFDEAIPPLQNNPFWLFKQTKGTLLSPTTGLSPDDPHFRYETAINGTVTSDSGTANSLPLFTNDFNGFVIKKTLTRAINQVDRVTISGNGWSRLFGCTRRLIKPSYFTDALYQQGQLLPAKAVSGFQTVYAGKPLSSIVRDLFDLVFRIDFSTIDTSNNITTLNNSYFNLSSLIAGNTYPVNLFNVPAYLLACVMKRRGFVYLEPKDIISFTSTVQSQISSQVGFTTTHLGIPPEQFQGAIESLGNQIFFANGFPPVIFNSDVQNLKAYFRFLDSVLTTKFSPDLKTPFEILEEIRKLTLVEIFETPYGQFFIRSPQYNNTTIFDPTKPQSNFNRIDVSMVRSSNLNIISNTYSETTENLITKLFAGYSIDGKPVVNNLEQFGYCDGKLLDQFGLFESSTVANPNVNLQKITDPSVNENKTKGIFIYCKYLVRILNARLKVMTVVCDFDPSIQVGYTFFDETNFRFGYIIGISKQVSVTGTAIMTLTITYVRDAIPVSVNATQGSGAGIISAGSLTIITSGGFGVQVEQLPVLTDLEVAFGGS